MKTYEDLTIALEEKVREFDKQREEFCENLEKEVTKGFEGKVFRRVSRYDEEEFLICKSGNVVDELGDTRIRVNCSFIYLYDEHLKVGEDVFPLDNFKNGRYVESTVEEMKEFIKENTIDYLKELGLE